jgi:hypothetical protein
LNGIRAGKYGEGSGLYSFRATRGAPPIGTRREALMRINAKRSRQRARAAQARFMQFAALTSTARFRFRDEPRIRRRFSG